MINIDEDPSNDKWLRKKKIEKFIKGGPGSGIKGHHTMKEVDFQAPNKEALEDFMQDMEIPFDKDYHVKVAGQDYIIRLEGWFPDCMESRDMGKTSTANIRENYKSIMEHESNIKADIHGYMPNYEGAEFGVSYVGIKVSKEAFEKAINAEALSGQAGYTPSPMVVDGHVKTKKLEDEGIKKLSEFYRKLEEDLLEQLKKVYG